MSERIAFIDFETRSAVDLTKCGVEVYAVHETTDALCLCWAFDDGPAHRAFGNQLTGNVSFAHEVADIEALFGHVASGGLVVAHNARFEINIWRMMAKRCGWPELRAEQVHDTMAMARVLSLPGSLGQLAHALKLPVEKDDAGRRLMLKMCKPRRPRKGEPDTGLLWHETQEELERLIDYCARDVEVERAIYHKLAPLSPTEQALWVIDQRINDRGVYIDRDAVESLIELTEREKERLGFDLRATTGGFVTTATKAKDLLTWCNSNGLDIPDLKKTTVANALKRDDLAPNVRRALEIRQEASKASTAKLTAMSWGSGADNRARGLLEYHGASTGRWAGRRVQPQNMPRTPDDFGVYEAETIFLWARVPGGELGIRAESGSVMGAVSHSLRSLLRAAPGNVLLAADYSNIEGRGLAWLAGEEWKLEFFENFDANGGFDNYQTAYSKSFGIPVEQVAKSQRLIGKVQELALGYQGGHGAFLSMGANYNIDMAAIADAVKAATAPVVWARAVEMYWSDAREQAEEILARRRVDAMLAETGGGEDVDDGVAFHAGCEAEELAAELAQANRFGLPPDQWAAVRVIVDGWRAAHPRTVQLWRDLDEASIAAVANPGSVQTAGRIKYLMQGEHLYCRLPNGRKLTYPYARLVSVENPWGGEAAKIVFEGVDSRTRKWGKGRLYGGILAENVTQATARDVLADAIVRLEGRDYPVVLHVHDEIVAEVLAADPRFSYDEFARLMATKESWLEGFPIAVDGWQGERYRK